MTAQEQTLKLVTSLIGRCERMVPKFAPGTSQHTLLKNRIQALTIGAALLSEDDVSTYSNGQLSAAMEPLRSIAGKCETARSKYEPGSGQYNRYGGTIRAMELCQELTQNELRRRTL